MQEKRYTVAVTRELHTAFKRLCRANNLIGLKVLWALVNLYSAGILRPVEATIPGKPYKLWLQLRCGAGNTKVFDRDLARLRQRMKDEGQEEVSVILRGLAQAFAGRHMSEPAWDQIVSTAQRRKRPVPA
jgi:hypothetical protein